MTTLKECPRTSFLSDYDLEHHFRTLAGNEERIAQQARTEYALLQTPGSRGAAAFRAANNCPGTVTPSGRPAKLSAVRSACSRPGVSRRKPVG